jgi:adenylate kinase
MQSSQHSTERRTPAIVLLGPTGSGKTPLGDRIQQRGLWRATCLHFDFGANLRRLVDQNRPDHFISREDLDFLRRVLDSGTLLEDEHFPLAERILRSFLDRHGADARTVVVLNGLPRHVGQAEAIGRVLDVTAVVHLRCSGETVLARIGTNVGGDRSGRPDDDPESIRNKLRLFNQRTAPLLDHYRGRGTSIETVEVTATMTPDRMWQVLDRRR